MFIPIHVALNQDHIRLLFGLKLKQLRIDKSLSLNDLSIKSGLSISYINEIEKGRKYPKSDKIMALSEAFGVDYDSLVSLKLSKKLEPISELLNSNILTELPLNMFGIDPADLLQMLSDAPTKLSAFIGTLIEISRNYNMSVEQFYFSALRTYQEMYDNYFEDLEQEAEWFLEEFDIANTVLLDEKYLSDLLKKHYGYQIENIDPDKYPELADVRSMTIPKGERMRLYINKQLSDNQRAFIFGREVGYQYMKLKKRLDTTSLVKAETFEELLNNYKAAYFSSAILIKHKLMAEKMASFFAQPSFDGQKLLEIMAYFNTTPETFCYRLSNVLPKYFDVRQLFFFRISNQPNQAVYEVTKEMHIARKHRPHTVKDEHYCRRWIAIKALQEIATNPLPNAETLVRVQRSRYMDSKEEYLVISFAKSNQPNPNQNVCVSMGILIDDHVRQLIKFMDDPLILGVEVNETCERCAAFDCKERQAAPKVLQQRTRNDAMRKAMEKLTKN